MDHFEPKNGASSKLLIHSKIFFKFCRMKGADRYLKLLLVVFLGKKFIWGNLIVLGHFLLFHWAWLRLSQATVTIGSLNSQDMISQLNIYVMDIVWISGDVYMCRSKFNRGSYGLVKLL